MGVVGTEQHRLHNIMQTNTSNPFTFFKTGTCDFVCVGESSRLQLHCLQPDFIVEEDEHTSYVSQVEILVSIFML